MYFVALGYIDKVRGSSPTGPFLLLFPFTVEFGFYAKKFNNANARSLVFLPEL